MLVEVSRYLDTPKGWTGAVVVAFILGCQKSVWGLGLTLDGD